MFITTHPTPLHAKQAQLIRRCKQLALPLGAVLALSLVSGCGSGGSGDGSASTTAPVASVALTKSAYAVGESLRLPTSSGAVQSARLVGPDGTTLGTLKIAADGSVTLPVVTAALFGASFKLNLSTASGVVDSTPFRIDALDQAGASPGLTSKMVLDASIANLQAGIDELISLGNSSTGPEITEAGKALAPLVTLRDAIVQAMAGQSVTVANVQGGGSILLDAAALRTLDQFYAALLARTSPVTSASPAQPQAKAVKSIIPSTNCAALTKPEDRAWCANMNTRITNDLIINYTGMAATVVGGVAAGLGALALLGVGSVAAPAALLGSLAIGATVVANSVGAAIQGASISGTGTTQGTAFRDNITNLISAGKDLLTGPIAKLLPSGGSDMVAKVNETLTGAVGEKIMDKVEAFVAKVSLPVANCAAAANSGGRGAFAQRYDFGVPTKLVLSYQAFTIPDQFQVFDAQGEVSGSNGLVSGGGTLSFTSRSNWVTVKVNAPTENTAWNYSLNCAP